MSALTLRREAFSFLHACFGFVEQVADGRRVPLWGSAAAELQAALALLPVLVADLGRSWLPRVTAVDASLGGFGVVETCWPRAAA